MSIIKIRIRNYKTGEPVPNLPFKVYIASVGTGVTTDAKGEWSSESLSEPLPYLDQPFTVEVEDGHGYRYKKISRKIDNYFIGNDYPEVFEVYITPCCNSTNFNGDVEDPTKD